MPDFFDHTGRDAIIRFSLYKVWFYKVRIEETCDGGMLNAPLQRG